jgi:hypothetical protein
MNLIVKLYAGQGIIRNLCNKQSNACNVERDFSRFLVDKITDILSDYRKDGDMDDYDCVLIESIVGGTGIFIEVRSNELYDNQKDLNALSKRISRFIAEYYGFPNTKISTALELGGRHGSGRTKYGTEE